MEKDFSKLKSSNFNNYPHLVFGTAFLVDGKVADYEIGDSESCWGLRTFRGLTWEKDILERSNKNPDILTCEYKSILVHNLKEHNEAFGKLEDWLSDNFDPHPGAFLPRFFSTNKGGKNR